MFKTDPQYIVAGEIVRTTRIYAMSVSPLSKEVLERLSPNLFANFGGEEKRKKGPPLKGEKLKKPRDFTHSVKIGDEIFEIETVKGKKEVRLPWDQLARIRKDLPKENYYKGLKGTILVEGEYTLLAGEKLDLILSLAPSLDMEGVLERSWPRSRSFNSQEDLDALLEELPKLLSPAPWKQGQGRKGRGEKAGFVKALGFVCLFTDGEGVYWFKCSRGFHTGLNESLASLESLIDELGEDVDIGKKHIVNQVYRRLSNYLG
jgi:hypothetical protein